MRKVVGVLVAASILAVACGSDAPELIVDGGSTSHSASGEPPIDEAPPTAEETSGTEEEALPDQATEPASGSEAPAVDDGQTPTSDAPSAEPDRSDGQQLEAPENLAFGEERTIPVEDEPSTTEESHGEAITTFSNLNDAELVEYERLLLRDGDAPGWVVFETRMYNASSGFPEDLALCPGVVALQTADEVVDVERTFQHVDSDAGEMRQYVGRANSADQAIEVVVDAVEAGPCLVTFLEYETGQEVAQDTARFELIDVEGADVAGIIDFAVEEVRGIIVLAAVDDLVTVVVFDEVEERTAPAELVIAEAVAVARGEAAS